MNRGTSSQHLNFVGKEDDDQTPPIMVTSSGEPIPNYRNGLTVGPRGCPLMMDHILLGDLQHTTRARIPERVFHARGTGAHGYFEVTRDITRYCGAKLFNQVGKRTPVFTRFSVASGGLGIAETQSRGLRGMACKFYTEEGNWDLTSNNAQVFLGNDPMNVISVHNSAAPIPDSNLSSVDRLWDFLSLFPESTFFQVWLQSDFGLPYSYRFMDGFAGNVFKLVNKHGEPIFAKFILKTNQGLRGLTPQRAAQLAGINPDFVTQDLVEAIERGDFPSWTLNIQVMSYEVAQNLEYNPFDVTKIWEETRFPLIEVGRLVLNRNTANHFDEAEQATFNPGHLVPGIRPAEGDISFAGRIFVYQDTQLYRMGVNHNQLPINMPLNPVKNYQRGGRGVFNSQGAAPVYFPNSFGGPVESEEAVELDPIFRVCGDVVRNDNSKDDHFAHPRIFWNSLLRDHQQRVVMNFAALLKPLLRRIREQMLENLGKVDPQLRARIEDAMNQIPDVKEEVAVEC